MSRIPSHSVDDAPAASRALLEEMIQFSPTGRPLNLHAQMAHSPAVLEGYVGLRRANGRLGTLAEQVRSALMLAAAAAGENEYAIAITSALALRFGWRPEQVQAVRDGKPTGDPALDALLDLVREGAGNRGKVSDETWKDAAASGWNDEQLAEAFAYLGLTVYTAYFLNYAATELDVPTGG